MSTIYTLNAPQLSAPLNYQTLAELPRFIDELPPPVSTFDALTILLQDEDGTNLWIASGPPAQALAAAHSYEAALNA